MDRLERAGVTRREREVLALLGERLTNAEIAGRLYISVRTVESHVSSLLTKLDVKSRLDLAGLKMEAIQHGFPAPLTSLIGRERHLAEIEELLGRSRLLTLTGVAGLGKTRLAIESGGRVVSEFSDGASFMDLAPIADPALVAPTLAKTLLLPAGEEASGSRLDDLVAHLSTQHSLLVLDNCEHLMRPVIDLIERLLPECPMLKVLATSREAFGMAGETIYRVPPLDVPDESAGAAGRSPAVRLLAERAAAVRSDLDLLEEHPQELAEICRRLDGLPLAIELAAVQLAHLAPADVASRLDQRFRLLTGRLDPGDRRWATLQAAIDWSYDLLSEPERILLARLGVFAGEFSLEAAEAVCAGDDLEAEQIQELLGSLVWKSLIVSAPSDRSSRYQLLETIREYALHLLDEAGQIELVRAAHCEWFAAMAEEAAPRLVLAERATWLTRLGEELSNLRAALRWSIATGRATPASRLVVAMWRYWHMRGDLEEGRYWAGQALAMGDVDPLTRARTLEAAGGLAWWAGAMADARDLYEEALGLLRDHGDPADVANALYNAAMPYAYGVDVMTQRALDYAEEAIRLYRELDDEAGIAKSLWGWAASAMAADMDREARERYEEALAIFERLDDIFMLAWCHRMLGRCLLKLDEIEAARPHLNAGIELFDQADDVSGIILQLRDYAELAIGAGDGERALTIVGAISALQERSHMDLLEGFSEQLDGLEVVSEKLGTEKTAELLGRGRTMTRRQAIDYARS